MKVQSHPPCAGAGENFERWLLRMYEYIDHAIPPLATAFLVGGLVTTALHIERTSHYMLACGLLLHLTVWFAKWLFTCRRN